MKRKGWKPDGSTGYNRNIGARFWPWARLWVVPQDGRWSGSLDLFKGEVRGRTPEECAEKLERRLCDWLRRQSERLDMELKRRWR